MLVDSTAIIDHDHAYTRAWGIICGPDHYRANVTVLAIANAEPPDWMTFDLQPPHPDIALEDWFLVAARPAVAELACDLVSVTLDKIDLAGFQALAQGAS